MAISFGGLGSCTEEPTSGMISHPFYEGSQIASDEVADPEVAVSTLSFGPIDHATLRSRALIAVSEASSGEPEITFSYATRMADLFFTVRVADPRLETESSRFSAPTAWTVGLERAGILWRSSDGAIDIEFDEDHVHVEFDNVIMESVGDFQGEQERMRGTLDAEMVRACAYRAPASPGAPVNGDGKSATVLTPDPEWASPFCSNYRDGMLRRR